MHLYKLWVKNIAWEIKGENYKFQKFPLDYLFGCYSGLCTYICPQFRLGLVSVDEWYLTQSRWNFVLWKFQPTFPFGYCVFVFWGFKNHVYHACFCFCFCITLKRHQNELWVNVSLVKGYGLCSAGFSGWHGVHD